MAGDRNKPQLEAVIANGVRAELRDWQFSFPAIVQSYDAATQRATVLPAIRIRTKRGQQVDPSPVTIPVAWPGWGAIVIQGVLDAGDEVIVECMDTNWNAWLISGSVVDNEQIGQHAAGYAVARPYRLSAPRRSTLAGPEFAIGRDTGGATILITQDGDGSVKIQAPSVRLGSALPTPALAVARDTDPVNTNAAFTTWRTNVEAGILAAGGGVVTPLVGAVVGTISATSTEVEST